MNFLLEKGKLFPATLGILFALFKEVKLSMLLFMTPQVINFQNNYGNFLFFELSGKELNQGFQVLKSLRFYHSPSPA